MNTNSNNVKVISFSRSNRIQGLLRTLMTSLEIQNAALPVFVTQVNGLMENLHMIEDFETLARIEKDLCLFDRAVRRLRNTIEEVEKLQKSLKGPLQAAA